MKLCTQPMVQKARLTEPPGIIIPRGFLLHDNKLIIH